MITDDKYHPTHKAWDELAARYRDGFNGLSIYTETYIEFCNLCEGNEILEIGCGPATITHKLVELRPDFKILATDVSQAMVLETKKILPSVSVLQLDARNINTLARKFDAVVCGFCLPYLDKSDARNLISDISNLLQAGGLVYLSYVPAQYYSAVEQTGSDGQYKMMFHFFSDEDVVNWAGFYGLRMIKSFSVAYENKAGHSEVHRVILLRKKK